MPTSSFALEKGSIVEMKQWEPEGKINGKNREKKKKKKIVHACNDFLPANHFLSLFQRSQDKNKVCKTILPLDM